MACRPHAGGLLGVAFHKVAEALLPATEGLGIEESPAKEVALLPVAIDLVRAQHLAISREARCRP